jgi:acetate kinase
MPDTILVANAGSSSIKFQLFDSEAANAAVNATGARLISTGASRVRVYVIPTDEERMIAHHTLEILRRQRRR